MIIPNISKKHVPNHQPENDCRISDEFEGTTILGYFMIFSETSTSPGNQHVTQAWG
jgi:hypothetical protein